MKTFDGPVGPMGVPEFVTHDKTKCASCNCDLTEEDTESNRIHALMHLILEQINKFPMEYGVMAMMQLLVTNSPYSKEGFMQCISDHWDYWNMGETKDNK